ncbi:MAG: hypothetical protein JNN08_07890 [Bryobacterales bacterium]|nr:hypothetical protein [Bryobacterales bacterium]
MTRRALAALLGGPLFAWHVGWSIVLEEVHDRVEIRIDGPTGKLLRWKGRGSDKVSWTRANCEQFPNEQRPLDAWVAKDAPRITLWARVSKESGGGRCKLKVLRDDQVKVRWEFDKVKTGEIEA